MAWNALCGHLLVVFFTRIFIQCQSTLKRWIVKCSLFSFYTDYYYQYDDEKNKEYVALNITVWYVIFVIKHLLYLAFKLIYVFFFPKIVRSPCLVGFCVAAAVFQPFCINNWMNLFFLLLLLFSETVPNALFIAKWTMKQVICIRVIYESCLVVIWISVDCANSQCVVRMYFSIFGLFELRSVALFSLCFVLFLSKMRHFWLLRRRLFDYVH